MTDREKLAEMLVETVSITAYKRGGEWEYSFNLEEVVDHMIAHGATVKEQQKPLTLEAAIEAKYVCIEHREIGCNEFVKLYRHSLYKNSVQVFTIGCLYPWNYFIESYGKEWRCWAEKPTMEERKNAKWEE